MNMQTYEMYKLIHDLLLVTTYNVQNIPSVVDALNFLKAGINEFESQSTSNTGG